MINIVDKICEGNKLGDMIEGMDGERSFNGVVRKGLSEEWGSLNPHIIPGLRIKSGN